jgi:hypothetical protein
MWDCSIFCSFLWFISSVVYSFHCRGLSLPLLSLFQVFFEAVVNRIVFLYSFPVCSSERLLIFYPGTLWKVFMMYKSFLGLLGKRSCHLHIGIVWLLPFLFEFLLVLLPILLLSLVIARLCWIRVERVTTLSCSWL